MRKTPRGRYRAGGIGTSPRGRRKLRIALFALSSVTLVGVVWYSSLVIQDYLASSRGIVYGEPPGIQLQVERLGVNVALEQYDEEDIRRALDIIWSGGYRWIRQYFPWHEIEPREGNHRWQSWDTIVELAQDRGLGVIAVLHTSPEWARTESDAGNPLAPPADPESFARFARDFARRYAGDVDYYQIWDQPNIAPHWGAGVIDPQGYVRLLQASYLEIKAADPLSAVLSAGLAPNAEDGGRNLSDLAFLARMYDGGARDYFDILGVKSYGFWSGPEDRRVDGTVLNLSRAILLREEMRRNADTGKPVWAVEFGWNALPMDWTGKPSPWGTDTQAKQAERTTNGLERIRSEWPWVGAICLQHFQPNAQPDDPAHGFSLVEEDLSPRVLYNRILEDVVGDARAYPGWHASSSPIIRFDDGWRREGDLLVATGEGAELIFPFWGTRVDLVLPDGEDPDGALQAYVDGRAVGVANRQERRLASSGQSRSILTRGLSPGRHELRLVSTAVGRKGVAVQGFVVRRDRGVGRDYVVLGLMTAMGMIALAGVWLTVPHLPWRGWWRWLAGEFRRLKNWQQMLTIGVCIALFWVIPLVGWYLLALTAIALLFFIRPDLGLVCIVAAAPFHVYTKSFGGFRLSLVEILTILAMATYILRVRTAGLRRHWTAVRREGLVPFVRANLRQLSGMDWAIAFFALACMLSLATSIKLRVSLRELRVVVLESLALYLLVRNSRLRTKQLVSLLDGLIVVGVILSVHGLAQFAITDNVIVAEGVRRVRSVYGSPNNLALVLGRIFPIALTMALLGPTSRRRILCGVAAAVMVVIIFLTYSRGAWLLGVPAAVLFLGAMRSRRSLLLALLCALLAVSVLLPLVGTQRVTSLFQFTGGTTFLRLRLWEAAISMIRDHALLGVGMDNFLYLYPEYILPGAEIEPGLSHPHNLILDFWVRLGIPGLVALVWMLWAFFRSGFKLHRAGGDAYERALTLGVMASMINFIAHGLIDNSFFLVELAFVFMLSMGVLRSLSDRPLHDCEA